MDIFESLENLNVSEECFDEIMGLVEETIDDHIRKRKETLSKRKDDRVNFQDYQDSIKYKYSSPGHEDPKNLAPTLSQKVSVQAEKKGMDWKKEWDLKDKAAKAQGENDENSSPEEKERAEKSREELRKPIDYTRAQYHADGGEFKPVALPDYQRAKKVARKALRGHTVDGTATPEKEEWVAKAYSSKGRGKTRVHSTPRFLYRIGKKVMKHADKNKQQVKESLLEELMTLVEDLRTLQRQHSQSLYDKKKKREAKISDIKRKKRAEERARYAYDDHDDYYDYDDDDRDYMDVIARKSPGVSYTSAEWHDND